MTTDPFRLNAQQTAYLDTWMNRVSRSFALVIPCLEEPLNHYLATAYLLCRVIDNIEDSLQPFSWKAQRFAEIAELLERPALAARCLDGWESEAWPGLTFDEQAVMGPEHGLPLWEIYALIPPEPFAIIRHWALAMVAGMRDLAGRRRTGAEPRHLRGRAHARLQQAGGPCGAGRLRRRPKP